MGLERIVIEVSGDPKKLKSTISELEKLGIIDKENAEKFRKNGIKFRDTVNKNSKSLATLKNVLGGLGIALSGAFAVQKVTQGLRFIIDTTKNFEAQMSRVKAITGATSKEFQLLSEDAKRLGASTKFTATEVGQLQEAYAKLGFSTSEIIAASEATLQLATATGEGLAGSAEVAGATLRAFGLDASETGRVVDVMAKSFTSSALDLEAFRESMKLVAPIAKAANIPIETTTALLGKLADAGLKGSIAGTSLKNLLSKLSDENSDLSKELGFAVKNTDDLFRAFQQLKQGNIDLTAATELTDERSKAAFLTLINGVDSAEQLTEALNNVTGAAKEMADIVQDNLQGDITQMNSAIQGLAIALAEGENGLSANLRSATQASTGFFRALTTGLSSIPKDDAGGKTIISFFAAFLTLFSDDAEKAARMMEVMANATKRMSKEAKDAIDPVDDMSLAINELFSNLEKGKGKTDEATTSLEALKKRLREVKKELLEQALAGNISSNSLAEFKKITDQLAEAQRKLNEALKGPIKKEDAPDPLKPIDPKSINKDGQEAAIVLKDRTKELNEIRRQAAEEAIRIAEEEARRRKQIEATVQQAIMDMASLSFDSRRDNLERELQDLETKKEFELQMAGDSAKARENIEQKFAAEERKIRQKQAQVDKDQASFNAAISTFTAAAKALEIGPIAGPVLAAFITALGIAQQIKIANQPLPKFEKGGWIDGKPHAQGGTVLEAEKDEFIVNKLAAKRNKKLLEDVNKGKMIAYNRPKNIAGTFAENVAASLEFNDQNLLRAIRKASKREEENLYQIYAALQDNYNARKI